jgi:antibiotic biosynthesis monooxygenase (ABM) superfamily enzyme
MRTNASYSLHLSLESPLHKAPKFKKSLATAIIVKFFIIARSTFFASRPGEYSFTFWRLIHYLCTDVIAQITMAIDVKKNRAQVTPTHLFLSVWIVKAI